MNANVARSDEEPERRFEKKIQNNKGIKGISTICPSYRTCDNMSSLASQGS